MYRHTYFDIIPPCNSVPLHSNHFFTHSHILLLHIRFIHCLLLTLLLSVQPNTLKCFRLLLYNITLTSVLFLLLYNLTLISGFVYFKLNLRITDMYITCAQQQPSLAIVLYKFMGIWKYNSSTVSTCSYLSYSSYT